MTLKKCNHEVPEEVSKISQSNWVKNKNKSLEFMNGFGVHLVTFVLFIKSTQRFWDGHHATNMFLFFHSQIYFLFLFRSTGCVVSLRPFVSTQSSFLISMSLNSQTITITLNFPLTSWLQVLSAFSTLLWTGTDDDFPTFFKVFLNLIK